MRFNEYYLNEAIKKQKFIIPDAIKDNYKIVGDMSNIDNWEAKIILGNSGGKRGKLSGGKTEKVGYVIFSTTSNVIIPVSRNDEHQIGYDLLRYLLKKKLVPTDKYVSIYAGRGSSDFVSDDKEDIQDRLIAYQKYLSFGGDPTKSVESSRGNYHGTIEDFIKRKGNITYTKGELAIHGTQLINDLEYISKEYIKIDSESNILKQRQEIQNLFDYTIEFVNKFLITSHGFGIYHDLSSIDNNILNYKTLPNVIVKLENAKLDNNIEELSNVMFGMNGIKNTIHNKLRQYIKKTDASDSYDVNKYKKVFADLDMAYQEFNRLGSIK